MPEIPDIPESSRLLLVLRHGKSDWEAGYAQDFDRPLAKRGLKAARKMGEFVAHLGLKPDLIIASTARRAFTTAELVAEVLGIDEIQQEPAVYGGGQVELGQLVSQIPDSVLRAMLVGHNPGLESLVEALTGESNVVMKTCSLAVLEGLSLSWASQDRPAFRLLQLYHPRELPDSF